VTLAGAFSPGPVVDEREKDVDDNYDVCVYVTLLMDTLDHDCVLLSASLFS